jgi:hypothetical protein
MSGSDGVEEQPVTESPEGTPPEAEAQPGPAPAAPNYPPRDPTWKAFLNPASLIIGAAMISWTIWWTRDTDEPAPVQQPIVVDAASTAPPEATAPGGGAVSGIGPSRYGPRLRAPTRAR